MGEGEGRWYSVGRLNVSLREKRLVDAVVGFEYDAGCWLGRVVVERLQAGTTNSNKRILFQLEFVGFTRLGSNALQTLNLRPQTRKSFGFDARKARSMTDAVDNSPAMPDALEAAAQLDRQFAETGRLVGPLHGIVFAIKDRVSWFTLLVAAALVVAASFRWTF